MRQAVLFEDLQVKRNDIVNVASVPQRSPFRYPGGKTWLVPRIRQWFASMPTRPAEMVEPFAGGGIVSLTVAFERLADHVTMVELDDQVAAVWHTVLNGGGAWLADEIASFDLTIEAINALRPEADLRVEEKAFRTIVRNRTVHGGILAPGSGKIKYGEAGRGIRSRWYPETLKRRILAIAEHKHRITFVEGDGIAALRQYAHRSDAVSFIDPPYTAAGKRAGTRLYTHYDLDHEELFRVTSGLAGEFLMTYDDAKGVRDLAKRHGFDTEVVGMKNTHHAEMTELLIGRDLGWVRSG